MAFYSSLQIEFIYELRQTEKNGTFCSGYPLQNLPWFYYSNTAKDIKKNKIKKNVRENSHMYYR